MTEYKVRLASFTFAFASFFSPLSRKLQFRHFEVRVNHEKDIENYCVEQEDITSGQRRTGLRFPVNHNQLAWYGRLRQGSVPTTSNSIHPSISSQQQTERSIHQKPSTSIQNQYLIIPSRPYIESLKLKMATNDSQPRAEGTFPSLLLTAPFPLHLHLLFYLPSSTHPVSQQELRSQRPNRPLRRPARDRPAHHHH